MNLHVDHRAVHTVLFNCQLSEYVLCSNLQDGGACKDCLSLLMNTTGPNVEIQALLMLRHRSGKKDLTTKEPFDVLLTLNKYAARCARLLTMVCFMR